MISSLRERKHMKYPVCNDAGLVFETDNGIVLNEEKLFRQLSYQEVLDLEFMSVTGKRSIDRGKVDINTVEVFLEKKTAKA
jgi:hypothetical protein